MKKKARLIILITVLAAAAAAVFLLVRSNGQKEERYREAVLLQEEGGEAEAYRLFRNLEGYRDAGERAKALAGGNPILPFQAAEKGEILSFGRWEQDQEEANGPETLEWLVLDRIEGRLLLLSAACLEGGVYHETAFEPVTWETCSLRAYLNGEFLNQAFTEEERLWIPEVVNENPDHSILETPGGRDTRDRVFLLSERDTVIYLKEESDQMSIGRAPATPSALADGLQTDGEGYASWWLRSPGTYEYTAQFVDQKGAPYIEGASTDIDYLCGIRPAIWLDVNEESGGGQS